MPTLVADPDSVTSLQGYSCPHKIDPYFEVTE